MEFKYHYDFENNPPRTLLLEPKHDILLGDSKMGMFQLAFHTESINYSLPLSYKAEK